jgi:hypothetical protein
MTKAIENMTELERALFDMYCDLEYALTQEYDMYDDIDTVSKHLRDAVGTWSTQLHGLGLLDTYLWGQAQKMAAGDESWVNS